MSAPSGPRVAVVGARRARQGLGPFVVRALAAAGADVCAFLATRPETLEATRRALAEQGVEARGHLQLATLLERETPDALVVLSPAETHRAALEAALAARLHVLCEKPLVWGEAALGATAARLTRGFADAGLVLRENCQWPYTLPAFGALHPGALDAPPDRFEMWLQPANPGVAQLGDALPHVLSLLQALVPGSDPRAEAIRFARPAAGRLEVAFDHHTGEHVTAVRVGLERVPAGRRREAAFAVDGRLARRRVSGEDFRIAFHDGARSVPVEDPMPRLVADFVRDVSRALAGAEPACDATPIRERMALLEQLVVAYPACGEPRDEGP